MEKTQFILRYTGKVTVNHEYTVTLEPGYALAIDWFPDNDLIIETETRKFYYNTQNTIPQADGSYLVQIENVENLTDVPIQFERGDYLVAGNIVIDQNKREYFTAEQLDILPDELVAAHHNQVTRILFSGDKTAVEHYVKP